MTGTVQNATGAIPVVAKRPPPEGLRVAQITASFSPTSFSYANQIQLNAQSGVALSQVVSLIIDNGGNPYPISVTHGALNETVGVPANTQLIVPTFSTTGYYALSVSMRSPPSSSFNVTFTLLNYERQPGSYSTIASTIVNTGQNSAPIYSNYTTITSVGTTTLTAAGNWILDSYDFACEALQPTAVAACGAVVSLQCGGVVIHTTSLNAVAASVAEIPGAQVSYPSYRTWPQGLILPRGNNLNLVCPAFTNLNAAFIRVNISGFNAP